MGLPTVSMGLLAVTMQPSHALAIVIVPAIITNIWQTFVGPYLRDIVRRLWPLMAGTVIGIWLNAGMLTAVPFGVASVLAICLGKLSDMLLTPATVSEGKRRVMIAVMLAGVAVIVTALTYFPALTLGPLAEGLL